MRKRGANFNRTSGHTLTPNQIEKLMLPIHNAIALLPLGVPEMGAIRIPASGRTAARGPDGAPS